MYLFLKIQIIVCLSLIFTSCKKNDTPEPFGALPSPRQMEWHKMDYYAFVHFNINTFSDLEWGEGSEAPSIFNPSKLDCRQWAKVCKDAGMEAIIITAKHHDGFCLWPSKYTEHSVKNSPWREGEGDLLKELSAACKEFGLKMGIYISPWDRNNPLYGTAEYNGYFINQLTEVLTNYGEIFEIWFDGANGEGPNGKKQEYDWDGFIGAVRKHQPNAVIFSDAGPDIRWIGNERGYAKETNWSTLNRNKYYPGTPDYQELTEGNQNGTHWLPAEVNVSIRPGWYYHKDQDDAVKSVDQLEMIYYQSVGRSGNLLLNLPVDRRGLIHENEIIELTKLKNRLDNTFLEPVPITIPVSLAFTPGYLNVGEPTKYLLDDDLETFWSSREDVTSASFEIQLPKGRIANVIEISEFISLGQRVEAFEIEGLIKGRWQKILSGTTIGWKRLIKLPNLDCHRYRFKITKTMATPLISNIKMYYAPHNNYLLETEYDFEERMNWWKEDKLGMFINWDSFPSNFAKSFNPVDFDAEKWVQIAKSAGMKYIMITAKNRDGFCFWDTETSNYNVVDASLFKRDILKELSEVCKKEEIKLGFYYSVLDSNHLERATLFNTKKKENPNSPNDLNDYIKSQVRELIENYDPAIMWFDEEQIPEWTHKMGLELYQFVRTLKPEIIINNRIDKGRNMEDGTTKTDQPYAGDFETPLQNILPEGLSSFWEAGIEINDTFNYKKNVATWKTTETLIHNLIETTSKRGNFLLKIETDLKGNIHPASMNRLKEIGDWLKINGEAIYQTQAFEPLFEDKNIRYALKKVKEKDWIYVILLSPFVKEIILQNLIPVQNSKIYLLGYKNPLEWKLNDSNELQIFLPENFIDSVELLFKNALTLKIKIDEVIE